MQILTCPDDVNRARPARAEASRVLTIFPHVASTALFMKHEVVAAGTEGEVAATDSLTVKFWPAFFLKYKLPQRQFILLHEYLHAAFAHPARAVRLQIRLGKDYNHAAFNIAADAIINKGISSDGYASKSTLDFSAPEDAVSIDRLYEEAEAIKALTGAEVDIEPMKNVSKLTVEMLYSILMRLKEAAECACSAGGQNGEGGEQEEREQQQGDGDGQGGMGNGRGSANNDNDAEGPPEQQPGGGSGEDTKEQAEQRQKAQRFVDRLSSATDLILSDIKKKTPEEIDEMIRQAGEKLKAAKTMHGRSPSNILETLAGDIPQVNTPWEKSFRSLTQRHLSRERVKNHRRPGRRVLVQEALDDRTAIWSPARRRLPVPKAAVILDSSGSVDAREYKRYLGELQAMKRRTNAHLIAIVADAAVQSVSEIEDVREIADVEFKGRGGTDFRPGIALAEEMDVDLIIYLTDLGGTFPEKPPKTPVIWAACSQYIQGNAQVPFGRLLELQ